MPPMEVGDIYQPKHGWQHLASKCTDTSFVRARLVDSLSEAGRAMLRSHGGPLTACPFTCVPTSRLVRIDSQPLRVMLLRRLLPLPFTARVCRCGRLQDIFGHHRSACAVSGVVGSRGAALESAAARIPSSTLRTAGGWR